MNYSQTSDSRAAAERFLSFVNSSPSPYHAADSAKRLLQKNGFVELKEKSSWDSIIQPNGLYYFTRNGSSLIAFAVGGKYKAGNGFNIIGAHTDTETSIQENSSRIFKSRSPNLWRWSLVLNLGVAGSVMIDDGESFKPALVNIKKPILYIPNLAIHLDRSVGESFKFNKETHLYPMLALASKQLNSSDSSSKATTGNVTPNSIESKHHPIFLSLIAEELGVDADLDLSLYDVNPAIIGGACDEFLFSARLDNLNSSFCATEALIKSVANTKKLENDERVWMIGLFDHEEIGSRSAYGAESTLLADTIKRLQINGSTTAYEVSLANSFLVSADMAHAIHPNYSEKHEDNHSPQMNAGIVIKINANQRYATTSATSALFKKIAANHNIPVQEFVVRNDSPCGSTIGPLISSNLGIRTIDVGNPMLSMHSVRETMGTDDVQHSIQLFEAFLTEFSELDRNIDSY
ncbi:hypothetical protein BB560_000988 [Smittium megazygosporum]|uniref:aspartyl aminopeptidase n=1 Tax=Smittium megazygosporum TaxID=133381 RepID=A0A2T9ZIY4_9FUNG|nr:hypothetical protein BB560_000988 [Smittium megazygosporum]